MIEILVRKKEYREILPSRLFKAKIYGQVPVNTEISMDIKKQFPEDQWSWQGNFQNMRCYNKFQNQFEDVDAKLKIPYLDFKGIEKWQPNDGIELGYKMNWLSSLPTGSIYMWTGKDSDPKKGYDAWWGTLVLGGNIVCVEEIETLNVTVDGENTPRSRKMGKLRGFRRSDWSKDISELVATGLVHRCYCAYGSNNTFGDTPVGIVYSPFWSPIDWKFSYNQATITNFYVCMDWLEPI
jgi:hypothetical protein